MTALVTVSLGLVLAVSQQTPETSNIALLVDRAAVNQLGPEGEAAWQLARDQGASLITTVGDGTFANPQGRAVTLDQYSLVWIHQGDSAIQSGPIHSPQTLQQLTRFVDHGGGLFLSGAALAMVHSLRIEPARPRLGGPGNDRNPAWLVPVVAEHPIFRGVHTESCRIHISDRGFPAFSDFHGSGGPRGGMLLGRTPGGSEQPLVEYALGKGRIIAMGWRLPIYSYQENPFRGNLQRLTLNIFTYLGSPKSWQPIVINAGRKQKGRPPRQATSGVAMTVGNLDALERAVRDLASTFPDRYPHGADYLRSIEELRERLSSIGAGTALPEVDRLEKKFRELRRRALLDNPLLDFDRILLVKRGESSPKLGLVNNWQSNSSLPTRGYDDEIAVLSGLDGHGALSTLYRPEGDRFVGDVDLHWDATRMLFSMPGDNNRWQVCEVQADGRGFRQLPLIPDPDVDNYDACYLPDGDILFTSTACFTGVPCVKGSSHVSNIYRFDTDSGRIRRLTFEQDHDWCPTVMNNGRVLYLRWEYSGIPHFVSRILFHMNPDGTEQMAYYGTNSYWPNSIFFARPCPNHATRFVGIVSGHHDVPRMGELILFDVAKGRREAGGAVQRIPGYGKPVVPEIRDDLVRGSWPKFLHPWPLSDKYFLVSAKLSPESLWGIYLVDVFDNMLLLREEPYYALLEPIPLKPRRKPPVIPSKQPRDMSAESVVHISDIYAGEGLRGVPRGTVKRLRLFTYQFAYHGMGGQINRVGLDGPWDVKRILGTVPVDADGSASFRVPANTPISIQPLDEEGKAVQLMRSWMVAMPGEVVSCTGCHEDQNSSAFSGQPSALARRPSEIEPWYGPARGFSFRREVQPVLDHHCVGCHNGRPVDGRALLDFTDRPEVAVAVKKNAYRDGSRFSPSYLALRSFVRTPTIESDIHSLNPSEFHADTTRLVQLLEQGHYGVSLEPEAWDRIITWIDLNTPYHGTWHEIVGMKLVTGQRDRRREMDRRYAGLDIDPEAVYPISYRPADPPQTGTQEGPPAIAASAGEPAPAEWAFAAAEAVRRQKSLGAVERTVSLGDGVELELVQIPAGQFTPAGPQNRKGHTVSIDSPFWMGKYEVTNAQFAIFDPSHDSRIEHGDFLQFSSTERGYPVNLPEQPVCRVSWRQAEAFCQWLSRRTGMAFSLPTEMQWEWACRAGTDSPLWYGGLHDDFSTKANLADYRLRYVDTFGWSLPSGAVPIWRPAIESVDDGYRVSAPVGSFEANPWGLCDMHGNVWEWTATSASGDPASSPDDTIRRVVRGGSWYTRPQQARSDYRVSYPAWFRVYDVGFRVVCRAGVAGE